MSPGAYPCISQLHALLWLCSVWQQRQHLCGDLLQRAVSPDSSPDRLMSEGMPESTIKVAVPSYPAEFGNEAYRIAEDMEAGAAGDQNLSASYANDVATDNPYTNNQPQAQSSHFR